MASADEEIIEIFKILDDIALAVFRVGLALTGIAAFFSVLPGGNTFSYCSLCFFGGATLVLGGVKLFFWKALHL